MQAVLRQVLVPFRGELVGVSEDEVGGIELQHRVRDWHAGRCHGCWMSRQAAHTCGAQVQMPVVQYGVFHTNKNPFQL